MVEKLAQIEVEGQRFCLSAIENSVVGAIPFISDGYPAVKATYTPAACDSEAAPEVSALTSAFEEYLGNLTPSTLGSDAYHMRNEEAGPQVVSVTRTFR